MTTAGVSAAPVACSASSLVTAVTAVAVSGGTVTLTAGCTYTMTAVDNVTDGPNAFPDILGNVTVVGSGATITRSSAGGTPNFRFFIVDDGGGLNISNVTLSNGSIGSGDLHGGAAILNRSLLTVTGVTFSNNDSQGTTGGGAIDNHDKGELTINNSTFSGNVALQGGGIEDEATLCHTTTPVCGQSHVNNSTFTNNSTTQFGGGGFEGQLDNTGLGIPPICGPTWPQPSCQEAGGAHDYLTGDTFSGNTSVTEGGGVASFGTMTVTNSTITGNSTGSGGGGGIQNTGALTITLSTIDGNSTAGSPSGSDIHSFTDTTHQPGTTALTMSIVSGGNVANCGGTNPMTDNGYNLDSGASCGFSTHALNSTNPMLGSLASHGGPTQTMALQAGSPAIDAIPSAFSGCSGSTDQRGVGRPQNGACDIGAFEVDTTPPTVPGGVNATAISRTQVNVGWTTSTDNLAVTGYTVYRDGSPLTTVSGSTVSYADMTVVPSTTYSYTIDAFDEAGNHSAQSSPPATATTPDFIAYKAVTPVRLLDTRNSGNTLGNADTLNLTIGGVGSVPRNAIAVVLNVTAVDESTAGAFVVYPAGTTRPLASNLNWVAHETVPNLVTVGLGAGGAITIYNGAGTADAVVDLEGYYAPASGTSAGEFVPVVPARITDTRPGSGQANAGMTLGPLANLDVQVTGAGGIPATGVSAVVMNVTATNTTAPGFFTVFPTGVSLPLASNLNWMPGVTVPNRVIVPVGTGGQVRFHNGMGSADLIVDVNGYFTDSTLTGASFSALNPTRIVDTRYGIGGFTSPLAAGSPMVVTVAGSGGVPDMGATTPPIAVVVNVTVEGATAASDLMVWPDGASLPVASDLNFKAGQTVPNLVIVKLSPSGKIDIRNDFGSTSVIVDVVGWFG